MLSLIIILIFLLLLLLGKTPCLSWKSASRREYGKMVKRFGKPFYYSSLKGGTAVWKKFKPSCPFLRVAVIDDLSKSCECSKNIVHVTTKYQMDSSRIPDMLKISDTIKYDKLKEEITVKNNSLEECMAMIILAHRVSKNSVSLSEVEKNNLVRKYCSHANVNAVPNYRILQSIKTDYELKNNYAGDMQ
jgi:hypothetical protein